MTKAQRQPKVWLTKVAKGTPTMVAMARPSRMRATACARLPGGATDAATSAATPK